MQDAPAQVLRITEEGGVVLDRTIFYPSGGGQPGDSGRIEWTSTTSGNGTSGRVSIATAVKGEGGEIVLVPAEPVSLPPEGTRLTQHLDWQRRHRHMRVHTALHLLSVVIPLPVSGGAIGAEKGRLDFDMPDAQIDRDGIEAALNALIECDLKVSDSWISDDELRADPSIVKTMSVMPPLGQGRVRLVRIGAGETQVDLQPCGGTHVARTAEIGRVTLGKIEKKGRQNRRFTIHLDL
ncbi:alanyl-tRNA editing protein [Aquimixticola soesokkakensis]|nr:alanyl-tRNA editing protein [Aquimixticola soesokkakensis]